MIGWLIVSGILLLLLLVLLTPLCAKIDYTEDGGTWRISYFGITLFNSENTGWFRRKEKKEAKESDAAEKERSKEEKQKKKKKKKKRKAEKQSGKSKKPWKERLQQLLDILAILPKPLRFLWKGIWIRHLTFGVQVGKFDAKECAVTYGAVNGAVYPAIAILQSAMHVQIDQISVQCAFGQDKQRWVLRGKLCVSPLAAVVALISLAVGYVMKQKENGR